MKRFLTTHNNLFKAPTLGRAFTRTALTFEAKPSESNQRYAHSLTFQDKLAFLVHDHRAVIMLEEKLHLSHSVFEKILDNIIINTIPNIWMSELQSIKTLWDINRGSEAMKKCDALIKEIEAYPTYLLGKSSQILCEAYIFKGDFLRLTGALEKQARQAFDCYKKALAIIPENAAAKDGIENLRIIRGESTKTIIEEPDPEIPSFKY